MERALKAAAAGSLPDLTRALVDYDPQHRDGLVLSTAAFYGHLDVIDHLLTLCDPKAGHSSALSFAAENQQHSVVERLLPLSDVRDCWTHALAESNAKALAELVPYLSADDRQRLEEASRDLPLVQDRLLAVELEETLKETLKAPSTEPDLRRLRF